MHFAGFSTDKLYKFNDNTHKDKCRRFNFKLVGGAEDDINFRTQHNSKNEHIFSTFFILEFAKDFGKVNLRCLYYIYKHKYFSSSITPVAAFATFQ